MNLLAAGLLAALPDLLVPGLDARSWREREAAHRRLAALGSLAVPALQRGTNHRSPEVAQRCRNLLEPYRERLCWEEAQRYGRLPWLHLPWVGSYQGELPYLQTARRSGCPCGAPDWTEYRQAARLWLASQLMQRRPRAEIAAEVERMRVEEVRWTAENRP